ncbi:MAG: TonB-system energizer ExbB [Sulfurovum sp.]|nr:MAG: TonB-system energizer ExbB [Sulfurovum sp.]
MNYLGGIVDYGILGILSLMSFLVLFFWIERLLYYRKVDVKNYSTIEALELDVTKHISIISSFGANAPYIGLLGTVLGIIVTFYSLGQSGNIDVKIIMTFLALALKATAMGLVVAIPAIFFYNHLSRKVDVILTKWTIWQKEKDATPKI